MIDEAWCKLSRSIGQKTSASLELGHVRDVQSFLARSFDWLIFARIGHISFHIAMPPRLKAVSCRTIPIAPLRCRYNGWKALVPTLRQFSATTIRCTRQRRVMMMWLENQGANFREPLAGSTNYLGAYDNKFRLRRLANDSKEGEENGQNLEGSSANDHEGEKLPPEGSQDLTPFPLNKNFRSERVTSEALREAVWEKVMKEQQSVRTVSAELGVEMSRVGAIVRLKEIEKEWIRTVSSHFVLCHSS